MSQVVIIGNGITGITAARHIRKAGDCDITVISSETPHFYSRTALMYIFMGHMTYEDTKPYEDHFWDKNRIRLVQDTVVRVDSSNRRVMLKSGDAVGYDSLIISTGSTSNMFGWPGQDLKGVQGLYSMDDLHAIETYSQSIQHAVVVGGGLIGIELTEMLLSRNISVSFLIREDRYWTMVLPDEEARMIEAHIKKHKVDLRLGTELKEILPDDNGRVRAVVTSDDETIPCGFVGLTVGVSPSIGFLEVTLNKLPNLH